MSSSWQNSHYTHLLKLFSRQLRDWYAIRSKAVRWYYWNVPGVLFTEVRFRGRWRWDFKTPKLKAWLIGSQPFKELHVDLGSGDGAWIVKKAVQNPHIHFVALERDANKVFNIIYLATKAFQIDAASLKRFPNLTVVLSNMRFIERLLPRQSVDIVYLNYPSAYSETIRNRSNRLKDLIGIQVIDQHLAKRVHTILNNNGSVQIASDNLQQAISIIDVFRHPTVSRLYLSRYAPPYFGYEPPSPEYGLKLKQNRDLVDGARDVEPRPSATIQSNFDQIEKNRVLRERDGVPHETPQERVAELVKRLPFGTPSDWLISNTEKMAAFPMIPELKLKVSETVEKNSLESSMGQKKVLWKIMQKYYQAYENLAIASTLYSTQQKFDWSLYATTRLDATEPFKGIKKKNFIRINPPSSLTSSYLRKEDKFKSFSLPKPSPATIQAVASIPIDWRSKSTVKPALRTEFASSKKVSGSSSNEACRSNVQRVSDECIISSARLVQNSANAGGLINHHGKPTGKSNQIGHRETGFKLEHPSVTTLKELQIDYASIPSSTISTVPFKPFVTNDPPLLQPMRRLHYIEFLKVDQNAANARMLNGSYEINKTVQDKKSKKGRIEMLKFGYFKRQTRRGKLQAKVSALKQKKIELEGRWKSQRERLLRFANTMESAAYEKSNN